MHFAVGDWLDIFRPVENFECVFVAGDFVVAFAQSSENVRVVELGLANLCQFGVLLESESQMINSLLVALVVQVGFADVVMGHH